MGKHSPDFSSCFQIIWHQKRVCYWAQLWRWRERYNRGTTICWHGGHKSGFWWYELSCKVEAMWNLIKHASSDRQAAAKHTRPLKKITHLLTWKKADFSFQKRICRTNQIKPGGQGREPEQERVAKVLPQQLSCRILNTTRWEQARCYFWFSFHRWRNWQWKQARTWGQRSGR